MDSRVIFSITLTWILILEFCVLIPKINSQIPGCSIEGINLVQCLNQGDKTSIETCCKTLSQAVQSGYNCLCSLLASSNIPLLNAPISLPFSNCFISVPPLTLCRVLAPMPIAIPPSSPEQAQTFSPPESVILPPPPQETMQLPLNSTTVVNTSNHSTESSAPKCSVVKSGDEWSSGENETKMLMLVSLFLCLAVHVCILFA